MAAPRGIPIGRVSRCPDCGSLQVGTVHPGDRVCRGPVADVAREFEQAERSAPAIADVPFSLEAEPATRGTVQRGLF